MVTHDTILKGIKYHRDSHIALGHSSKHYSFYTCQGEGQTHYLTLDKRKGELSCTCIHGSLQGAKHGAICSHKIAVIFYMESREGFK